MARGKHEAPAGAVESKNQAAGASSSGLHEAGTVTPVLPAGESLADRMGNEMPSGVRGFDHRNHSRKVRITLSICAVLLVALLAALVYFFLGFVSEAQDLASDSTDDSATVIVTGDMGDAGTSSVGMVDEIIALPSLLGLSLDDAVKALGPGASVSSSTDVTEAPGDDAAEGAEPAVVGKNVTIALPKDSTASSAYVTTDASGVVISAGCSASVSRLGYGDASFTDLIGAQQIVQNTLASVGVMSSDTIELPSDKAEYTTYAEDGQTVLQESYTFKGSGQFNSGASGVWTLRLSYDYSSANVSGNLSDTIKLVYVSIASS